MRALSLVAAVSGLYDLVVGTVLLFAFERMAAWFGAPAPDPPLLAELNGVFLLAVGLGYILPWRDPRRYRGYLWVMGPFLKGTGAALFIIDYVVRDSPASFLLFAGTDGSLALVTLWALLQFTPDARVSTPASGSTPGRPHR